jgi:hypothetical protein
MGDGTASSIMPRHHQSLPAHLLYAALLAATLLAPSAHAELSAEDLAKIAQNPVANLISVPIQENAYFNVGPLDGTQNVLNIQPVIPFSISEDWNIITRTIIPIISLPAFAPDQGGVSGIGDVQFSAFLSPANAGPWIWGVGAIAQLPTHSNDRLGNNNMGLGPTFVILHLEHGSPWVYGVLANNVWSVGSSGNPFNQDAPQFNNGLIQPFLNYNFEDGSYLSTSPILTVNWKAPSSQQWTVPMGGAVDNVVKPDFASNWSIRAQVTFLFPK